MKDFLRLIKQENQISFIPLTFESSIIKQWQSWIKKIVKNHFSMAKPFKSLSLVKGQFCKTSNFYQAAMHLWNCQRQEIIQSISTAAVSTCYSVLNRRDKRLHLSSFLTLLFILCYFHWLKTEYYTTRDSGDLLILSKPLKTEGPWLLFITAQ